MQLSSIKRVSRSVATRNLKMAEKSELAMNLGSAYGALGDTANRNAWLEKAKTWAPKGSPIYKYFHPGQEQ
jgi:hypothetical protein